MKVPPKLVRRRTRVLNLRKLQDEEKLRDFQIGVALWASSVLEFFESTSESIMLHQVDQQQELVDHMDSLFSQGLMEVVVRCLRTHPRPRKGHDLLLDPDLRQARANRRRAHERLQKTWSRADLEHYKACLEEQRIATQRSNNNAFQSHCDRMKRIDPNEVIKIVASNQRRRARGSGSQLASDRGSLEVYCLFYAR